MAESVSKQLLSAVTEGHTRRNSPSTSHSSRRNKRHTTTSESIDNNRDRSRSRIRNNKLNQSNPSNERQQSSTSSKRSPSTTLSSGYKSEDSEAINSIASRTRSHSQRHSFDHNNSTVVTSADKRYRSESDTSELRQTDNEDTEYTPKKQATQRRKKESSTSKRSAPRKSTTTQSNTVAEQKTTSGDRRRKLRSSNSRTETATTTSTTISDTSSAQQTSSTASASSVIPKKRFRQSDPEALNLGARLAKSSSGREPQQRTSTQETHTTGQPPSLLRRSSRSKGNFHLI